MYGYYSKSVVIRPFDHCERSAIDVTWCMNIWNPTGLVEACINNTWTSSSPLATELGILAHLEYVEYSVEEICPETGCLRVTYVEPYYSKALFTSTVKTASCSQQNIILLNLAGADC